MKLLLLSRFSRVWLCATPIDGSPPGSAVPGILQARTLEWVAISFSSAWKWKVKAKSLSCVQLFATPWTAAHQAPPSVRFSRQEYSSSYEVQIPYSPLEGYRHRRAMAITGCGDGRRRLRAGSVRPLFKRFMHYVSLLDTHKMTQHCSRRLQLHRAGGLCLCLMEEKSLPNSALRPHFLLHRKSALLLFVIFIPTVKYIK